MKLTPDQEKGLDSQCETVLIEGEDGSPVRINAHEFDKEKHKKFEAPAAKSDKKAK